MSKNIEHQLTETQDKLVESIKKQFSLPYISKSRHESSDLINELVLDEFGDILRVHHIFSQEPFSKDKFEYAFVKVLITCGFDAEMASKGNRGNDVVVNGIPISLKTQADRTIKRNEVYISKFMELGKGKWTDDPLDLLILRDSFIQHMESYDRIFSLRCLIREPNIWEYELVEIPKILLREAINGKFTMMVKSPQNPKPGYCRVHDSQDSLKFELYFDGGTERKLQIKKLAIKNCIIHASWKFEIYKEPAILD